jgi:hypothetical protein
MLETCSRQRVSSTGQMGRRVHHRAPAKKQVSLADAEIAALSAAQYRQGSIVASGNALNTDGTVTTGAFKCR